MSICLFFWGCGVTIRNTSTRAAQFVLRIFDFSYTLYILYTIYICAHSHRTYASGYILKALAVSYTQLIFRRCRRRRRLSALVELYIRIWANRTWKDWMYAVYTQYTLLVGLWDTHSSAVADGSFAVFERFICTNSNTSTTTWRLFIRMSY